MKISSRRTLASATGLRAGRDPRVQIRKAFEFAVSRVAQRLERAPSASPAEREVVRLARVQVTETNGSLLSPYFPPPDGRAGRLDQSPSASAFSAADSRAIRPVTSDLPSGS